jgi:hypothetical protein
MNPQDSISSILLTGSPRNRHFGIVFLSVSTLEDMVALCTEVAGSVQAFPEIKSECIVEHTARNPSPLIHLQLKACPSRNRFGQLFSLIDIPVKTA